MPGDIQFDEPTYTPSANTAFPAASYKKEKKGLSAYLISHQIVKDQKGADKLLLGVSIVLIIASVAVYYYSGVKTRETKVNISQSTIERLPLDIQKNIRESISSKK